MTPDDPALRALERLNAFVAALPSSHEKTQALIDINVLLQPAAEAAPPRHKHYEGWCNECMNEGGRLAAEAAPLVAECPMCHTVITVEPFAALRSPDTETAEPHE
jgi:hypothetical protein